MTPHASIYEFCSIIPFWIYFLKANKYKIKKAKQNHFSSVSKRTSSHPRQKSFASSVVFIFWAFYTNKSYFSRLLYSTASVFPCWPNLEYPSPPSPNAEKTKNHSQKIFARWKQSEKRKLWTKKDTFKDGLFLFHFQKKSSIEIE